jgi:ribosomal protein L7/L12
MFENQMEGWNMEYDLIRNLIDRLEQAARDVGEARHARDLAEARPLNATNATEVHDLMSAMANGRMIDAIRAHRSLTGCGLKESKEAVERVMHGAP